MMRSSFVALGGVAILASALLAVCAAPSGHANPPQRSEPIAVAPGAAAQFPDFASLASKVDPTVVAVEAEIGVEATRHLPPGMDEESLPPMLRRFFGGGMEMPRAPQLQRGQGTQATPPFPGPALRRLPVPMVNLRDGIP